MWRGWRAGFQAGPADAAKRTTTTITITPSTHGPFSGVYRPTPLFA